jgi:hypothetical protein
MEISAYLRSHAKTIRGKQQLIIGALAKALEIIPRQICDNAGFDATDVLNQLRMRHAKGETWAGVDIESEGVRDNMEKVRPACHPPPSGFTLTRPPPFPTAVCLGAEPGQDERAVVGDRGGLPDPLDRRDGPEPPVGGGTSSRSPRADSRTQD